MKTIAAAAVAAIALVAVPSASAHLFSRPKAEPGQHKTDLVREHQRINLIHARGARLFLMDAKRRPAGIGPRAALELRWHRAAEVFIAAELDDDWLGAVEIVGIYYGPDLRAWLLSCPKSEGGYGPWVPNRQGSGAGGWLQFMLGTFESVIDDAIVHARAQGMSVPSSARSWYSPLGQAIAGVEMLADGRRGEWSGVTC